jgi:hypothetical protein
MVGDQTIKRLWMREEGEEDIEAFIRLQRLCGYASSTLHGHPDLLAI